MELKDNLILVQKISEIHAQFFIVYISHKLFKKALFVWQLNGHYSCHFTTLLQKITGVAIFFS